MDKQDTKGQIVPIDTKLARVTWDSGTEFLIQSTLNDPELDTLHANIHRNTYIADQLVNRTI